MPNEKILINANDAFEIVTDLAVQADTKGVYKAFWDAARAIQKMPAVDAVEVVHGEWSTIEDEYCGLIALHCSVCNHEWWFEDDVPIKHYHYCPNCGAKMDGGNEDG